MDGLVIIVQTWGPGELCLVLWSMRPETNELIAVFLCLLLEYGHDDA